MTSQTTFPERIKWILHKEFTDSLATLKPSQKELMILTVLKMLATILLLFA